MSFKKGEKKEKKKKKGKKEKLLKQLVLASQEGRQTNAEAEMRCLRSLVHRVWHVFCRGRPGYEGLREGREEDCFKGRGARGELGGA